MKERGIIFSGPMVRALLAGTKTQTRRIIKDDWWRCLDPDDDEDRTRALAMCPYGLVGDRLWVRETWQPIWSTPAPKNRPSYDSRDGWNISYVATDGVQEYSDDEHGLTTRCKPAIFMPRILSRITLEVTGVRVERLQDISEEDARAEGVDGPAHGEWPDGFGSWTSQGQRIDGRPWAHKYLQLWMEIHGSESVHANPWVWAISFRRVEGAAP